MTRTYWAVGFRIVEHEQGGLTRAGYGKALLTRLSRDLVRQFGRGFSVDRLETMRLFYLAYPGRSISATASRKSTRPPGTLPRFPLPWSHYVVLIRRVRSAEARRFYETEALRGGWTVRQLERQVGSQFYERTLLSRKKVRMLENSGAPILEGPRAPEEEIKDPFVLEFLELKDEYSESDLEQGLISRLEAFLLELGNDFTFVGRQRRLRVGNQWQRIDLLFFHRGLRCLVVIDLKLGELSAADVGQMHLYLNYARVNWTRADENPPVGLILCAQRDEAIARYTLEGPSNRVLAAEYRMALPDERLLVRQLRRSQRALQGRLMVGSTDRFRPSDPPQSEGR